MTRYGDAPNGLIRSPGLAAVNTCTALTDPSSFGKISTANGLRIVGMRSLRGVIGTAAQALLGDSRLFRFDYFAAQLNQISV